MKKKNRIGKAKFILGYPPDNFDRLVEFSSKEEADFNSEEWCEVEAKSLEEAKTKYEKTFIKWQKEQDKKYGCYTTKQVEKTTG